MKSKLLDKKTEYIHAFKHTGFVLIAFAWLALLWITRVSDGVGTDLYPMYVGAMAFFKGIDPYGVDVTAYFKFLWEKYQFPFASVGFVYPLPAVIGLAPVLLLPLPLALAIWRFISALGGFTVIGLHKEWRSFALLPFCFMPLHRAILINQPSAIWFALSVALIFAMRWRWLWLVGYCTVLLPCKPQSGLLFALAGIIWAYKYERRALVWIAGWGALIWGTSFVLQPTWVQAWLASVQHYRSLVSTPTLLPWGLLIIILCMRLPWYAGVAVAQVVLFPIADAYSTLPLLLAWVAIGGPLALVGSAVSWLWIFLHLPNTMVILWLVLLAPLIGAQLWRLYQSQVLHKQELTQ